MRIISGTKKDLELNSPHGHKTHPMSEKLRGAIFNALGDVGGLTILDPFCGTGALALEGLSRGAKSALCLDSDQHAFNSASGNIKKSGFDTCKLIKMNCSVWSDQNKNEKFDLIFLDPPYDDIKPSLLQKLASRHAEGVVVCSLPAEESLDLGNEFRLIQTNPHGDASLWFFKKI